MSAKLLTKQHLEFLSLRESCTGSSEFTLVKMPHCWESHVAALLFPEVGKRSCYCERGRPTSSTFNQLLSGHFILNSHRAMIDKNFSSMCETCPELEGVDNILSQRGKI